MGEESQELQLSIIESDDDGAKDKNNPNGDSEFEAAAKERNPSGENDDLPDEQGTTIVIIMKDKRRHHRWLRIALYVVFALVGQSAATLLGRLYYQEGGHSKWLGTLVQLQGFPIVLPLYSILASKHPSAATNTSHNHHEQASPLSKLAFVYVSLGFIVALDCYLFSVGLSYLPVSTFYLIRSSQLAFSAFFSFFFNSQKFTPYIINCLVLLTISSILLVLQPDSSSSSAESSRTEVSEKKYVIGFLSTVAAAAGYGLILSLNQPAFSKVVNRRFKGILDLMVYPSLVACLVTVVGLFWSGEFRGLRAEMEEYGMGKASYVMNLIFTVITWQFFDVGCVGLVLEVSSLFSNVISVLGLPIVPILALVFFHDKMNALKLISLLLAIWGFLSYTYQHYLDEANSKTQHTSNDSFSRDTLNEVDD